ncbi:MAG: hypothetical protein AAGF78_01575 [Pseudomonadota bacterium]
MLAAAPFIGVGSLFVGIFALTVTGVMMTIWPAGALDALGLAVAGAVVLGLGLPLEGWLASHVVANAGAFTLIFWAVMFVVLFCLWLAAVAVLGRLDAIHAGQRRIRHRALLPMSVEDALSVFVLRPGETLLGATAGQVDAEGFYPVSFDVEAPNLEDFSSETQTHATTMRLLEDQRVPGGGHRIVMHSCIDSAGQARSGVAELTLTPEEGGTRLEQNEVFDYFSILTLALYWLQDGSGAWIAGRVEAHRSGDIRSSRLSHQNTLMSRLAQFLVDLEARQADDGPRGL